jgi:hypothetical protein
MSKKGLAETIAEGPQPDTLGNLGNMGSTALGNLKKAKVKNKPTRLPTLGK